MSNRIDLCISRSMTKNSKTQALWGKLDGVAYPLIYFKKSAYISDEAYKELLDKGLSILVNPIPALEKRLKGKIEDK